MRIKQLEIYGYGKWIDTTFTLADDLQLFYGANEAGKSTLMSFVHSILFGFPTRNSTLLRYEPRESSRYGGKIIGEDARFGEVIIERIHGKVTGDVTVTLEDGTTGTDALLASVLYDLERDMFQNIFSFSLSDIENVHQLGQNQLSRYLLNIGAHGTEYYLELVDQFNKEANNLYRPSASVRPLNQHLEVLKKQEKKLSDLEKRNDSYLDLIEQNNQQNQQLETLEAKEKKIEADLKAITDLKNEWHVLEEIKTLEADIENVDLPPLKEDGRYLLEEYQRDRQQINNVLQKKKEAVSRQQETLAHPESMEHYEKHKETITELENELPEIVEQLGTLENLKEQRQATQQTLTQLEKDLHIEENTTYPTTFSKEEIKQIKTWREDYQAAVAEHENVSEDVKATKNQLDLKNQTLDQHEAVMWDNDTLKSVKKDLEAPESEAEPVAPSRPFIPLASGLAGVLLLILSFFMDAPLNWGLGLVGVLAFIVAGALYRKQRPAAPTEAEQTNKGSSQALLAQEYEKQVAMKDEWQAVLGEVDAIQARYQKQLQTQDQLLKNQQTVMIKWERLLTQYHLPKSLPMTEAEEINEKIQRLKELLANDKKTSAKQANLEQALAEQTAPIETVVNVQTDGTVFQKVAAFRQYLNQLKKELAQEEEKLEKLNTLKQESKQLENSRKTTEEKIENLIGTADVQTEADFVELYQAKEQVDKKKSRLQFLKENAPQFAEGNAVPTKEAVEKEEVELQEKAEAIDLEKQATLKKRANTELAIEKLEKDGTYTEERQFFENQKATNQRLVDDWVANKLAAGMIQTTLNQATNDRFQEIIADAESYFSLLTDGEYEKILFKDEALFVQQENGVVVDVGGLSRGTAEPLYVALRLAYIKNTQDMMELPLIMDDPFVNFDRTRQQNMYQLLERLGNDLQIIYFTFDPEAEDYFAESNISHLK